MSSKLLRESFFTLWRGTKKSPKAFCLCRYVRGLAELHPPQTDGNCNETEVLEMASIILEGTLREYEKVAKYPSAPQQLPVLISCFHVFLQVLKHG